MCKMKNNKLIGAITKGFFKILGIVFVLFVIYAVCSPLPQDKLPYSQTSTYIGSLGNWVGQTNYFFDEYKCDGNTYTLYRSGYVVGQITISSGFAFEIVRRGYE